MNFISRELVLEILTAWPDARKAVEHMPMFPAPNPNEYGNRNVMGQTPEQFWRAVERQYG